MFISGLAISGLFLSFLGVRIDLEARPEVEGTGEIWVYGNDKSRGGNTRGDSNT